MKTEISLWKKIHSHFLVAFFRPSVCVLLPITITPEKSRRVQRGRCIQQEADCMWVVGFMENVSQQFSNRHDMYAALFCPSGFTRSFIGFVLLPLFCCAIGRLYPELDYHATLPSGNAFSLLTIDTVSTANVVKGAALYGIVHVCVQVFNDKMRSYPSRNTSGALLRFNFCSTFLTASHAAPPPPPRRLYVLGFISFSWQVAIG